MEPLTCESEWAQTIPQHKMNVKIKEINIDF